MGTEQKLDNIKSGNFEVLLKDLNGFPCYTKETKLMYQDRHKQKRK